MGLVLLLADMRDKEVILEHKGRTYSNTEFEILAHDPHIFLKTSGIITPDSLEFSPMMRTLQNFIGSNGITNISLEGDVQNLEFEHALREFQKGSFLYSARTDTGFTKAIDYIHMEKSCIRYVRQFQEIDDTLLDDIREYLHIVRKYVR